MAARGCGRAQSSSLDLISQVWAGRPLCVRASQVSYPPAHSLDGGSIDQFDINSIDRDRSSDLGPRGVSGARSRAAGRRSGCFKRRGDSREARRHMAGSAGLEGAWENVDPRRPGRRRPAAKSKISTGRRGIRAARKPRRGVEALRGPFRAVAMGCTVSVAPQFSPSAPAHATAVDTPNYCLPYTVGTHC